MNRAGIVAAIAAALAAALSAGCVTPRGAAAAPSAAAEVDRRDADERATPAARAPDGRELPVIDEAWLGPMRPADNIDSPAAWTAPDGRAWVVATAKATDVLVVYDGDDGRELRRVGRTGTGPGEFDRPNGIAIAGDLAFVVERDNHRVQVLRLPAFAHVASFGAGDLVKPYGLWVRERAGGFDVYVTDAYMVGEDANGDDVLPPLAELDRRVKRYAVERDGDGLRATLASAFGDTGAHGALRVVESIWGDADNDRLLIAEEDEAYANELKVYDLEGRFAGRTIGGEVFAAQAEGIMLKRCAGGGGWWLTTEQGKGRTVFHLFDRRTLAHAGAVTGRTVANTDGIWLRDAASARFPDGVLYAVHDDQGVVALDWRDIAAALALPDCAR